jgi:transcriptional regulator with XRE-family HTH domain
MSEALRLWLSQELDRRGWSHRELARRGNISHSLVSKTIAGDMPASADFCIKVAQTLEASPEMVLRLAGILPPTFPASPSDDKMLQELVELARNLEPEDKQQVLDYIRFLYQKRKG